MQAITDLIMYFHKGAAVRSGDFAVATELARKGSGQCAQMLADVAAIAGGKEEKSAFLESRAGIFMATLRDKLDYLGIIVTMSPLLGLLGTIVGMIGAFNIFHVRAVLERIMCALHMDIFKHFFLTKIRVSTVFCAVCLIARV